MLGTVCGSNVPFRSRGTANSTSPISVLTVLGDALPGVAAAAARRLMRLVTEMIGELDLQTGLDT